MISLLVEKIIKWIEHHFWVYWLFCAIGGACIGFFIGLNMIKWITK
jgi:hypothetical protein